MQQDSALKKRYSNGDSKNGQRGQFHVNLLQTKISDKSTSENGAQAKRRKLEFVLPKNPKNGFGATVASVVGSNNAAVLATSNAANQDTKSRDEFGLFDPALVSRYLKWNKVVRVGPGFYNDGNSCYLNSTLQCLMYLPPLIQIFQTEGSNALKNISSPPAYAMKPICELFRLLVNEVWPQLNETRNGRAISPRGMTTTIRRVGKQFRPFRQEDAHEYLRQLLDVMHEEVLKANGLKTSDGKKAETTFISRIFGGHLSNTLTCSKCQFVSETRNHFLDLSLEIRQNVTSVEAALAAFTKQEQLSAGNEWKCEKCLQRVRAVKQMKVAQWPSVLVIHLKRFAGGGLFGLHGGGSKITKKISFPMQWTTPSSSSGKGVDYDLTGVIVHHGHSTNSGHYIAYVKASNGVWHEMNDAHVSQVSQQKVLSCQAYIIFYTQRFSTPSLQSQPSPATPFASTANGKAVPTIAANGVEDSGEKVEVVKEKAVVNTKNGAGDKVDVLIPNQSVKVEEDINDEDTESDEEEEEDEGDDDMDVEDNNYDLDDIPILYIHGPHKFKGFVRRFRQWRWTQRPNLRQDQLTYRGRNFKMTRLRRLAMGKWFTEERGGKCRIGDIDSDSEEDDDSDADTVPMHLEGGSKSEDSEEDKEAQNSASNQNGHIKSVPVRPIATAEQQPLNAKSFITSTTAQVNNKDVVTDILALSRRGRTIGSEGLWGDDIVSDDQKRIIETIATQQKRSEQEARRAGGLSLWDRELDKGRTKKIKADKDDTRPSDGSNPFQRQAEDQQGQKFHPGYDQANGNNNDRGYDRNGGRGRSGQGRGRDGGRGRGGGGRGDGRGRGRGQGGRGANYNDKERFNKNGGGGRFQNRR